MELADPVRTQTKELVRPDLVLPERGSRGLLGLGASRGFEARCREQIELDQKASAGWRRYHHEPWLAPGTDRCALDPRGCIRSWPCWSFAKRSQSVPAAASILL